MRIRIITTGSGKKAIQVISKKDGTYLIHKHIGSFANQVERVRLLTDAHEYIEKISGQLRLENNLTSLSDIVISESKSLFVYQLLSDCYDKLGFNRHQDQLIKDLIIARIYSPASKTELRNCLLDCFGKSYSLKTIYRHLKTALSKGLKEDFQKALVEFTRKELKDDLKLVFYDVTTLYFESQAKAELQDFGFSKDGKASKTQVVVGLVVNHQGFPLYFDVFTGSTFEGHTFLKVIKNVYQLLDQPRMTVVADAAMLSQKNLSILQANQVGFVVGARLASLPAKTIDKISSNLEKVDGSIYELEYANRRLICHYSSKRAGKDRHNISKQVKKAKQAINSPARTMRRFRFVKKESKQKYALNQGLIDKAKKLEGVKGYITNTKLSPRTIINRYHDLWKIEYCFRLTKSDLVARPIFHRLEATIKAHLVIVFAGLAICRYLEILTNMSSRRILKLASKLLTHTVSNSKTGETKQIQTSPTDPDLVKEIQHLKTLLGY